jgi:hypothetical protein
MTDSVSPDSMTIPAELIRDAVSAGLAKPASPDSTVAAPMPADAPKLSVVAEAPAAKPAPEIGIEPRPAVAPKTARPQLAGIATWAKTLPTRMPAMRSGLRWPAAAAAGMILTAGLGYGAAHLATVAEPLPDASEQRWSETAAGMKQTHADVARLAGELKSMRASLETLKTDRPRAELSSKQAQLNDKFDKASADSTAKITKLSEQLDRIEKTQRDPARIATLVEKLERIEKQTATVAEKVAVAAPAPAATPTPPPKPVAMAPAATTEVTTTGSLAEAKPVAAKVPDFDPRKTQLDSYILRDVDNDGALIEARNGRVFEVHPGQALATLGKVEAIERRGRQWIVVTSKGFIGERLP